MGEETIKIVLKNAGLTEKEALVYISLAKHEPLEGTEIAKLTKKDKAQIFRIIKNLQAKGFVESTLDYPARYTVTPFENILETVVKSKRKEITSIEKVRGELIHYLKKKNQIEPSLEKFVIIKGNQKVYSRISKIFKDTRHQLSVAMTFPSFVTADRLGVFDFALKEPKIQSKYRLLTEVNKENLNFIKALSDRMPKPFFSFKATNPDLALTLFPRMITRDNEEILFFTSTPRVEKREDEVGLWTNSKSLVQAFNTVFEDLWINSTDLQDRISEIEIGKTTPKTCFLSNSDEAKKQYEETLDCAEKEIILMTSSKSLNAYLNKKRLEEWFKKGISVRIMAPITSKNLKTVRKISKFCRVKHVPIGYPETVIVDDEHYFQFKTTSKEKTNLALDFQNAFYSNDFEYVHKMKKLFEDLWKNAHSPSPVTLETIFEGMIARQDQSSCERKTSYLKPINGLEVKDWKLRSAPSEREVLNKLLGSRKLITENLQKNITRMHGSMGSAIVHPPDSFKLPDMLFTIFHVEKHSSFGEEDSMLISIRRKTEKGSIYIPSAYVGDNPHAQTIWKAFMSGTPAGQNVQLLKQNEIQIQIHGTTLFVAWTRPIPLSPPKWTLPPSCLLMEGYGDLKTDSYSMFSPSGYKIDVERNGFEAFVTFFHPESKYSGPGVDGFFARDYVSTVYQPSASKEAKQGVS